MTQTDVGHEFVYDRPSPIYGDPKTWLITNPHPCLKEGDRVRIEGVMMAGFAESTPGTVQAYVWTSPRYGDLYHVLPDGYDHARTFRLAHLRLVNEVARAET